MLRTWALTGALVTVLALSGCGGGDDAAPAVTIDGNDSSAPAPTQTPTTTAPTAASDEPVDGQLLLGRSVATDGDQQAAADAWLGYWTEVFAMYAAAEPDPDALYAVAKDSAATGPLDYVTRMKERGERQQGGAIAAVTRVQVDGDEAVVEGCFRSSAVNVDRNGTAVELLTPFFTTREVLRREGPDWRVETADTTSENRKCDVR